MRKVIFTLFFCFGVNVFLFGQASPFSLSVGLSYGIPIVQQSDEPEYFFIKNFNSAIAFDMACRYKIKSNWEFGLFVNANTFYIDRSKAANAIIASQSSPGYLYQASGKGNILSQEIGLELSKIFAFKKWRVAPFVRSSIYYRTSSSFDLTLREKRSAEHYYQERSWNSADTAAYHHFTPLILTGGVRFIYQRNASNAFYFATQCKKGYFGIEAMKKSTDFYDNETSEKVNFHQNNYVINFEFGYKYTFPKWSNAPQKRDNNGGFSAGKN